MHWTLKMPKPEDRASLGEGDIGLIPGRREYAQWRSTDRGATQQYCLSPSPPFLALTEENPPIPLDAKGLTPMSRCQSPQWLPWQVPHPSSIPANPAHASSVQLNHTHPWPPNSIQSNLFQPFFTQPRSTSPTPTHPNPFPSCSGVVGTVDWLVQPLFLSPSSVLFYPAEAEKLNSTFSRLPYCRVLDVM